MRGLLFAAFLPALFSSANATETGYYNFTFHPDSQGGGGTPFEVCFYVENQGATGPFAEAGSVASSTAGPYGSPSGSYNIIARGALAIYMATDPNQLIPQYQYFLTAVDGSHDFPDIKHSGRYIIATSSQPPPPTRDSARRGSKLGGYKLVDTGSLSVTLGGGACE
jgi:hypothetical protein